MLIITYRHSTTVIMRGDDDVISLGVNSPFYANQFDSEISELMARRHARKRFLPQGHKNIGGTF